MGIYRVSSGTSESLLIEAPSAIHAKAFAMTLHGMSAMRGATVRTVPNEEAIALSMATGIRPRAYEPTAKTREIIMALRGGKVVAS